MVDKTPQQQGNELKGLRRRVDELEALAAEQARVEQELRQEHRVTLERLAGSLSHQLRGPLGAISAVAYYLQLVLEAPNPDVKETLEILEREVARAQRIISDVLEYASVKPPAGQDVTTNLPVEHGRDGAAG